MKLYLLVITFLMSSFGHAAELRTLEISHVQGQGTVIRFEERDLFIGGGTWSLNEAKHRGSRAPIRLEPIGWDAAEYMSHLSKGNTYSCDMRGKFRMRDRGPLDQRVEFAVFEIVTCRDLGKS